MSKSDLTNEYADTLGDLFHRAPKAVHAAVAVSMLTAGGDYLAEARERFIEEWQTLHEAGIVPQKPPRGVL